MSDEQILHTPIPSQLRDDPEVSKLRKYLIDFILGIGDRLKQRRITLQIAVDYIGKEFVIYPLDQLLVKGHLNLIKKDRHLWGVTALFLASKYDEIDRNIPYIKEFGDVSSRAKYSYSEVMKCETLFLNLLNWDICTICPAYFLSALLCYGCIFRDDKLTSIPVKFTTEIEIIDLLSSKLKSMKKFSEFFVDIALQSLEVQKFSYSIQAVASIVAARKTLGIKPTWNPKIGSITGYTFEEIEE